MLGLRTLLHLWLLQFTFGQPASPFPSSIATQDDTLKSKLSPPESNDNAAYQLAFQVYEDQPIRSEAFYQTIGLAFEQCLSSGTEHRGVWEFPTVYGLLLTIRPLVVPWYTMWELGYYLEAIAMAQAEKRATTNRNFGEGEGVFYKDGLAYISIKVVNKDVAKGSVAKRQESPDESTNMTASLPSGLDVLTHLGYILENATEDNLMLTLIRSLQLCLSDPMDFLPIFHFQDPFRFLQFTLRPGSQYVSVTKIMVVQVLMMVMEREYGVKEWWKGGRFREMEFWVKRGDAEVASGGLTYWPKQVVTNVN